MIHRLIRLARNCGGLIQQASTTTTRSFLIFIMSTEPAHGERQILFVASFGRQIHVVVGPVQNVEPACVAGVGVEDVTIFIPLGFLAIIMQGVLLAAIYPLVQVDMDWFAKGLVFGLVAGLFLGSSQIIADAAKRPIEPLSTWFAIEWTYFAIQFALAGLWFGWLYS